MKKLFLAIIMIVSMVNVAYSLTLTDISINSSDNSTVLNFDTTVVVDALEIGENYIALYNASFSGAYFWHNATLRTNIAPLINISNITIDTGDFFEIFRFKDIGYNRFISGFTFNGLYEPTSTINILWTNFVDNTTYTYNFSATGLNNASVTFTFTLDDHNEIITNVGYQSLTALINVSKDRATGGLIMALIVAVTLGLSIFLIVKLSSAGQILSKNNKNITLLVVVVILSVLLAVVSLLVYFGDQIALLFT